MTTLPGYNSFGGRQVEAAALSHVLDYLEVAAPHTGEPFSDALLFGIGGGIGAGYFVYASPGFTSLFIATQITGGPDFVPNIARRLGAAAEVKAASNMAAFEKRVGQMLAGGRPVISWVNSHGLPYPGSPASYHPLVIYGLDPSTGAFQVADYSARPLALTREEMAHAQSSGDPPRYRILRVEAPARKPNLRAALNEGLRACVDQMLNGFGPPNYRSNFGLAALQKWAGLLTDSKDKRGWPKFFPPGPALFTALATASDQIENRGGGSAFRPLYADFLEEAAGILKKPRLAGVAEQFRDSARLWRRLAAALLPNSVPLFKEQRQLAAKRRSLVEKKGMAARAEWEAIDRRLGRIKARVEKDFPLSEDEVDSLLAKVRERVLAIHAAETEAVAALKKAAGA